MRRPWPGIRPDRLATGSFEEIVEGGSGARNGRGLGFALHSRAWLEQCAGVTDVLRGDSDRDGLQALEAGARIEADALGAGMKIGAAPGAASVGRPRQRHRELVAASAAAHDLPEAGHVERLGGAGRRLPAWGVLL